MKFRFHLLFLLSELFHRLIETKYVMKNSLYYYDFVRPRIKASDFLISQYNAN